VPELEKKGKETEGIERATAEDLGAASLELWVNECPEERRFRKRKTKEISIKRRLRK